MNKIFLLCFLILLLSGCVRKEYSLDSIYWCVDKDGSQKEYDFTKCGLLDDNPKAEKCIAENVTEFKDKYNNGLCEKIQVAFDNDNRYWCTNENGSYYEYNSEMCHLLEGVSEEECIADKAEIEELYKQGLCKKMLVKKLLFLNFLMHPVKFIV